MELNYDITKLNDMMGNCIPEREGLQKRLFEAMDDAFNAGGKRIRPMLMYETYRLFCKKNFLPENEEEIAPFMTGLEMMHTASLIHDDLPCMDNDRLRRGKPTTWVSYGEDVATLAGDALMIDSFNVMSDGALKIAEQMMSDERVPNSFLALRGIKAIKIFAEKAGSYGMTGGQAVDVMSSGKKINKEQLEFIHNLKTGAMIEAAMMMGAVLGGADEGETEIICAIARDIGLAFQIKDDILDETASEEKLGKPVHSDADNNKVTYVTLYGLEKAEKEVEKLSKQAISALEAFRGSEQLVEIAKALITRDK